MQTSKRTLDREGAHAVDEFNLEVAEQHRALDAYNARIEPYDRLIDAIDAADARFNGECTEAYLERDMLAVRVEREAALKARLDAGKKLEAQPRVMRRGVRSIAKPATSTPRNAP